MDQIVLRYVFVLNEMDYTCKYHTALLIILFML